jgi:predicted phage baseplate assembly protein
MVTQERPLDLRSFDAIFEEAKRLIPKYCPEWTDHNTSDPGITLIELFAWMTDMILYQVNRVPDEMYERFLALLGIQRLPPTPAQAEVTFFLSGPRPHPETIDRDTVVATDRTENREAIIFTTTDELTIAPAVLSGLRAWRQGQGFEDYMPYITSRLIEGPVFNESPVEGDALFLGYEGDLAGVSLQLRIECRELEGSHIDPRDPPLAWEYWSRSIDDWAPLRLLDNNGSGRPREPLAVDPTHGLNRTGDVYLFVPTDSRPTAVDGLEATWIRVRYLRKEGQGYTQSPRVTGVRSETIGATVRARQAHHIKNELLGQSTGEPDQAFPLLERPVLRRDEPHLLEVDVDDSTEVWMEVPDFSESGESDRHFVLSYLTGEVRFGPSIRARDGTTRQFGAVARRNALIRMRSYYAGGGTRGNVGEGAISQLKSSIPYVSNVMNYAPARGGLNEESVTETRLRALRALRHTEVAITRSDYERLCAEVPGVGRAHCLLPAQSDGNIPPGSVRVILVPEMDDQHAALAPESFTPSADLVRAVSGYLDDRKILGTTIAYGQPEVVWVEIDAHIRVATVEEATTAQERAIRQLRGYMHPTKGGEGGAGLRFGGSVTESQVAGLLQRLPGVSYVERVRLRVQGSDRNVTRAQAPGHGILALGRCYVLAEAADDIA